MIKKKSAENRMGAIFCCTDEDKIKTLYSTIKEHEDEIIESRLKITLLEENSAMLIRNLEKEMINNGGMPVTDHHVSSDLRGTTDTAVVNRDLQSSVSDKSSSESSIHFPRESSKVDKKSLTERMKKFAATMTDFRQRNSKTAFAEANNTPISAQTKNMRDFM